MGGIKSADVICQFPKDGGIIPLQFSIEDEDGVRQTFRVRAYKPPSVCLKQHDSFIGRSYQTRDILDFECKIEVSGSERIVRLRYFVTDMLWKVVY